MVLLDGDLGAGKTTFVGGLALALDIVEPVRSPTYTVAHLYAGSGGRRLAHLDLYRQAGMVDEAAFGDVEPYLDAELTCIEWPDAAAPWLEGRRCWRIQLELHGATRRLAWVSAPGAGAARSLVDAAVEAAP